MVDVYICRHAHVDYTPPAEITPYVALSSLGHEMAARLAERAVEWDLQYLYASTMLRAQQTADAISSRLPHLPRRDMQELEETSLRDLTGYFGALPPEDMRTWTDAHYAYANAQMWRRTRTGWSRLTRQLEELGLERVAVVSHGGPINALLRQFLGEETVRLRTCWFELDWATTCCCRYSAQSRSVRWINDARHIDPQRHLIPPI